jgi:hypothetical protein
MPISFSNNNYSVIITPQQQKNTTDNELEICSIGIVKTTTLNKFYWRIYGFSSNDTPYGMSWFAIGY